MINLIKIQLNLPTNSQPQPLISLYLFVVTILKLPPSSYFNLNYLKNFTKHPWKLTLFLIEKQLNWNNVMNILNSYHFFLTRVELQNLLWQNHMKIGKAVFKEDTPRKIITPEVQSLLTNDSFWAIDHKRYQKHNWVVIFSQIDEITVANLILDYNGHKNIMKEISHIKFYHLKQLWLRENKISNIEDLEHIDAPCLQLLRISMNYIVKFKPIVKIHSLRLNQMYIPANPVIDFHTMQRACLNQQMNDIFLEYWSHNNIISQDLSFVVKLNPKSFHNLWIKADDRIQQDKVYGKIQQKYSKLNLYRRDKDED